MSVTEDYLNRFGGIARLYGVGSLEEFSRSHVMIVGLGGVGSWTVEALARSGVGQFTLVDLDDLCLTNTNRQIHATTETIGQSKATVLADRIHLINPEAECHIEQAFYTEANSVSLLSSQPDVVVDAIDSVHPKCHLLATCREQNIPIIASGGAGGRIDASQIRLDDLSKTFGDALLLSVRKRLRSDYRFPKVEKKARKFKIPAVFSPEQPKFPTCDGTTSINRPAEMTGGIKCDSGYGAATHLTATFGNLMAGWVLDQLTLQPQRGDLT
ncbi:MAG: tRNA threonylcarbamoyladenosine dehydratase [Akkermansiaceae bacterium]|jgi:tRNA A37 threonylcarbamoyladenosine dehydratase